jgi:hypothetical protein
VPDAFTLEPVKKATAGSIALRAAFEDPALTTEVRWQARYARQNGIQVNLTFMIDGWVAPDTSSGGAVEVWLGTLGVG